MNHWRCYDCACQWYSRWLGGPCACGHPYRSHVTKDMPKDSFAHYNHDADYPGKEPDVIWTPWLIMTGFVDVIRHEWNRWRTRRHDPR